MTIALACCALIAMLLLFVPGRYSVPWLGIACAIVSIATVIGAGVVVWQCYQDQQLVMTSFAVFASCTAMAITPLLTRGPTLHALGLGVVVLSALGVGGMVYTDNMLHQAQHEREAARKPLTAAACAKNAAPVLATVKVNDVQQQLAAQIDKDCE